jgi:hypothetical protein
VVNAGVQKSEPKMLSNPTMLTSLGTGTPARWSPRIRPIAIRSL